MGALITHPKRVLMLRASVPLPGGYMVPSACWESWKLTLHSPPFSEYLFPLLLIVTIHLCQLPLPSPYLCSWLSVPWKSHTSCLSALYSLYHHRLESKSWSSFTNTHPHVASPMCIELSSCLSSVPALNQYFNSLCFILTALTMYYLLVI